MYAETIAIWLSQNEPTGNCHEASIYMNLAHPELRVVRGHYSGYPHWWNVAPDGAIVDATVSQFGFTDGEYVAYCGREVYGKCHECGEHVYIPGHDFCCEACERACLADLNNRIH
jgi:hypothetical protein